MSSKFLLSFSLIILFSLVFISGYNTKSSGSSGGSFILTGISCENTSSTAEWVNSTSLQRINAITQCDLYSAVSGINCCPSGQNCNTANHTCYSSLYALTCFSYKTKSTCEGYSRDAAQASAGSSIACYKHIPEYGDNSNYTDCLCVWDSSKSNCTSLVKIVGPNNQTIGLCNRTSVTSTNCDGKDVISVGTVANLIGSESLRKTLNCYNETQTYKCPKTPRLGFFDIWSFSFSFICIVLVYFIMIKRIK